MNFNKIFFLISSLFFISSCATYEAQYKNPNANPIYPAGKKIEKTFYLVGDAGVSPLGGMSEGLTTFSNYMKTQTTPGNFTIFLGDNIYPSGMPPEGHPDRTISEYYLDKQYEIIQDYDGDYIFIPGNHEWYNNGLPGLIREENYLQLKTENPNVFQPKAGCPLSSIEVTENIQLIIIDSQWYLEDWNKHPSINKECEIKTREKLFIEIDTEIQKHQDKTILFAMHHPMLTNGTHGGYFGAEKHLFPTQKKWPLPLLSSLVTQIRAQGGVSVQDRYNELYNNLMTRLKNITQNSERLVFVSGHEHNLQYVINNGIKQIVSGAGAKDSHASLGKDGLFSTGAQGFAVLDVFEDGSSWVRYYVAGENFEPKIIYETEVFAPKTNFNTTPLPESFPATQVAPIYKQDSIQESLFLKTVWGAKYKDVFSTPVEAPVADLDTLYGGLRVIREGGQREYHSLRLEDKSGNEYRMRALGKNSLALKQKILLDKNGKVIGPDEDAEVPNKELLDINFYTASHPYAIMAVPTMAEAIGVFHNKSQLFYVPKQDRLGNYNDTFGDELYLISLEPTEQSEGEKTFKYPDDIETTDDILTKLRENDNVVIDEQNYIKSRLFDMLIGDWDREADHWRWAEYVSWYDKNMYVPIPRNRDDAFASFDGSILDIARSVFSGSRQSHVYGEDLTELEWFNKEGIILDRAILERSGRNQWVYAATKIQDSLTDQIIDEAFNTIPHEVQEEELQAIKDKLKARKENLVDIADRYYSFLANLQTVTGTDQKDYFEITRLNGGLTNVKIYESVEGEKGGVIFNRTYNHNETREIWIYGLDGADYFEMNGEDDDLIYVRVIGGHHEDRFNINEGRRIKIYDYESEPTYIDNNHKGSLIFSNIYSLNTYDYRRQIERIKRIAPALGYNPDDGVRVGLQYIYTVNSFKRNPFSKRHVITGGYYFDTNSFDLEYSGEFANSIGDANLSIGARLTSPNYTVNYFGYGNETNNLEEERGYDFNRIELQTFAAEAGLVRNSNFGSVFIIKSRFEAIRLNNIENSLYADREKGIARPNDTNYFMSLDAIYKYRSYDDPLNPARAMLFDLNVGITDNLEDYKRIFGYIKSRIVFYNALVQNEKLVLKSSIQAQFNVGNTFEFYQGVQLGANTGLRGFREERFTGRSFVVGSADVRYSFDRFTIDLFPVQIGVYAGADLGRVWIPEENSEKWHNSRGGGFWINSQGGIQANFSYFNSKEGNRLVFGLGFSF